MRIVRGISIKENNKEEIFSNISEKFPYMCVQAEIDKYLNRSAPWHWHKEVEIFYIKKGTLEYYTPKNKFVLKKGDGGIVNSNIIHSTKSKSINEETIQLLHIFNTKILSGEDEGKINEKYFKPFIECEDIEMIPFWNDNSDDKKILELIYKSFEIDKEDFFYEFKLKENLNEIWMEILKKSKNLILESNNKNKKTTEKLRKMLVYINENYNKKLTVLDISKSAFISERECFRLFKSSLKITPLKYLQSIRLQKAAFMLKNTEKTITEISYECSLGSSSYFSKLFKENFQLSPLSYKKKWQNNDNLGQK